MKPCEPCGLFFTAKNARVNAKNTNNRVCHSEHREESREEEERFIADALNDKESALNDRVEERAVHVGANLCVHPS